MNDLCQRWREGRHSWRHVSEGGFDRSLFEVAPIDDDKTAKAFVVDHHYSASYPSAKLRYGLYGAGELVGVAVLSTPTNNKSLTNVFPGLVANHESTELGRFVLLDEVPANAESWFLTQAFRLAAAQGIRGVLSCSDPLPRRADGGALIVPGHVGTIYQATNARYLGRQTARSLWVFTDGTTLNARSAQKIRKGERGAAYVEALLVSHGAVARARDENPKVWLRRAVRETGASCVRHAGNHRYAFALGRTHTERRQVERALAAAQPYPKTIDQEATAA
jgi:hypothetical protein